MASDSYRRAAMHFGHISYGKHLITVMHGNEPGYAGLLLVSVRGPGLPQVRILGDGTAEPLNEDDGPLPERDGLIVFGRGKHDRPRLADYVAAGGASPRGTEESP